VQQKDKPKPEVPFRLFSDQLLRGIERTLEGKGKVFLYAARRGLAPVVACIDCGYIFRCPDSNTPYSLMRTSNPDGEETRWFISSTSGQKVRAADVCPHCGSWRLRERGIGIQQVYDELSSLLPDTAMTILDGQTAPTAKKAGVIASKFWERKSVILIGTQVAIPYLAQGVDLSAIVSLDATRTIPTWRADESLFRLLLKLRECTAKEVLIQTRTEPDALLTHASRGALERFYDDEINLRRMLSYPPFSQFILVSWLSSADTAKEMQKKLQMQFGTTDILYYFNPHSTAQKTQGYALFRLPKTLTPKETALIDRIRALPPYFKVEVNPDRIV
jgi:primosomal protein N' (replication factor Y)